VATTKKRTWRVICVSLYPENLRDLDEKVEILKARGIHKMNRSRLLRIAVKQLDLDTIKGDDE
jgi:hypothetical protein